MSNLVLNDDARAAIDLSPADRTMLDNIRGDRLVQLARDHFDPQTRAAEIEVLRASAGVVDPPWPDGKTKRGEIRAELLRWLATDLDAAACIAPKGIRAFYVTVLGGLDFYGYRFPFPVMFWLSRIQGDIILQSAETLDFFVMNSEVNGSIIGDRVNVKGSMILRCSRICGGIFLNGAHINGDLDCQDAELLLTAAAPARVKQGNVVVVDYGQIGGGVLYGSGFAGDGGVSMAGAQVGKNLMFYGARVGDVDCRGLQLSGDLIWLGVKATKSTDPGSADLESAGPEGADKKNAVGRNKPLPAKLDISNANLGNLRDDRTSWPASEMLVLDGCVYKGLILHKDLSPDDIASNQLPDEAEPAAGERIGWLMRREEKDRKKPQPWLQLAAYLDQKGKHREAKHVLYRLKRLDGSTTPVKVEPEWHPGLGSDLRDIGAALREIPNWFRHPIRSFLFAFAWLEEVPFRICWSIGLVLVLGTAIFSIAAAQRAMAPTDEKVYEAFESHKDLPGTYPKLNPFIYTLENAVPLAKMGLDEKWAPDPHARTEGADRGWNSWPASYEFLMTIRWLLILSGWFQAAVLAAALSGLFKD